MGSDETDGYAHRKLRNGNGKASLHSLRRAFQIQLSAHANEEDAHQSTGTIDNTGGKATDLKRRRKKCVDETAKEQRNNDNTAGNFIQPLLYRNSHLKSPL